MKCILKTNPVTGNMRGATLHTTPIELLTILEALRIYEYERDNPIDKATVRQMLKDLKNREVEADLKTESSSEKPNNSKERLQACIDCEHTDMCEWCCTRWSKDEPQTCSFSDCDNFKNPDYERCIECKRKQIKLKTEQTERSE